MTQPSTSESNGTASSALIASYLAGAAGVSELQYQAQRGLLDKTPKTSQLVTCQQWRANQPGWLGQQAGVEVKNESFAAVVIGNTSSTLSNLTSSVVESLVKQLAGQFAFAAVSENGDEAWLATDKFGRLPLYYCVKNGSLAFASQPDALLHSALASTEINPQSLYNYIYFHMIPAPGTIYKDIAKLPPASLLHWQRGQLTIERYWVPNFSENPSSDAGPSALQPALQASVEHSINSHDGKLGAFLSGGLDSSSVVGMMQRIDSSAEAFAMGFDADGYDEMPYARLTAKHFGVRLNELYLQPDDVLAAIPKLANAFPEPFGNSSAVPTYACANFARSHGVEHMLAGDGGDELFAGNSRYAKQRLFEVYWQLPNSVRALLNSGNESWPTRLSIGPVGKVQSYLRQAKVPLPDRLHSYNYLHLHQPSEVFEQNFLASIDQDQPLVGYREEYQRPDDASSLNRMLYLDWKYTLADNDLQKVGRACELAGVNVSYPMLDETLVDLSCRVTSQQKLPNGALRDYYKRGCNEFLSEDTLNKPKHGFGLPFGVWMRDYRPLQEMAYDTVLALKNRQLFQASFIDETLRLHREEHATYYGELVWLLMALEQWLSAHQK